MNKTNGPVGRMKIGLIFGLLVAVAGCIVPGRVYYPGGPVVMEPDLYLFGGDYDGGRYVHNYSHRGVESRAAAHSSGERGGRR